MTDATEPLCVCGHGVYDHHVSWFAAMGVRIVEECENEECEDPLNAGAMPSCLHYRAEVPR